MSVAGLLVGIGGGYVAQHQLQRQMFVGCGLLALASLAVVLWVVREPRHRGRPRDNVLRAWQQVWSGRRLQVLLSARLFLFMWNFNPFSSNVLQAYMTDELGFAEQFFGNLGSVKALGMILGCMTYGWYCRRVPFGLIVHGSIVAGIVSTLGYWLLRDGRPRSWPASSLASPGKRPARQLDLSARICPTESAGTMFALLMAISNTGESAGVYLGGGWYDGLAAHFHGDRHSRSIRSSPSARPSQPAVAAGADNEVGGDAMEIVR